MTFEEYMMQYSKQFPFWDKLSQSQKELLYKHTTCVKYDKGSNIHGNSGECTGVVFVKSGCLRTYILSDDGKDITLYRLYPGEFCMLTASCVLKAITFDVFVDAVETSDVLIISPKIFSELTEQNVYVENFALNVAASRFSDVMWAMQQILFMSFDKRLAVFLIDELAKTGGDTVNLTHEQIAKYMGSAREVVSRMLKYFSGEGIVENSRGGVRVIDKKRLKSLI